MARRIPQADLGLVIAVGRRDEPSDDIPGPRCSWARTPEPPSVFRGARHASELRKGSALPMTRDELAHAEHIRAMRPEPVEAREFDPERRGAPARPVEVPKVAEG